jgi:hypothetical protein
MALTDEADLRRPIRKAQSVLICIPDVPHGIRGAHPSHRIAKMEYVLGWMEKWTGGKAGEGAGGSE